MEARSFFSLLFTHLIGDESQVHSNLLQFRSGDPAVLALVSLSEAEGCRSGVGLEASKVQKAALGIAAPAPGLPPELSLSLA